MIPLLGREREKKKNWRGKSLTCTGCKMIGIKERRQKIKTEHWEQIWVGKDNRGINTEGINAAQNYNVLNFNQIHKV